MSNSLTPVILVLVLSLGVIALLNAHRSDSRGAGGPQLEQGVFTVPTKRRLIVPSATMPISAHLAVVVAPPADERWQAVVIAADDDGPLTRAAMLGLAEHIQAAGGLAILDPLPQAPAPVIAPLALPVDHVLRVGTLSGAVGNAAGSALTATLRISASTLRLPDDHPAARLQTPGAVRTASVAYAIEVPAAPGVLWPGWYAAIGRNVAAGVAGSLAPAGIAAVTAQDKPRSWGGLLPPPPQAANVRWTAVMQQPGVRAWLGRMNVPAQAQGGRPTVPTELAKRLGGSVTGARKWTELDATSPDYRLWTSDQDGLSTLLSLRAADAGYDLTLWQELPSAVSAWRKQAADATLSEPKREHARELLRGHADATVLPDAVRDAIRQTTGGLAPSELSKNAP